MAIEKKKFRKYSLEENKDVKLTIKLNVKDLAMLEIGAYMFNMHSKSGILKELASVGLKVILRDLGAAKMHYLTRGDRVKIVQEWGDISQKVSTFLGEKV